MTTTFPRDEMLREHLVFVREHSPYFREAWREDWPDGEPFPGLEGLPVTDHASYWEANRAMENRLLTGPHHAGIVFKSGGTTGNPKFSFFSNEDWREFCRVFGEGLRRLGVQPGERFANLFYGGQLYASLFFFGRCLEEAGVGVHFPLAGFAPPEEIVHTLIRFQVRSIAGVPTTILHLLPHLAAAGRHRVDLRRILYGGETMYPDQMDAIRRVFPRCRIQSSGVAGVDFGELGWVDENCERGVHHVFEDSTVVEILDEEELRPLHEPGVEGAIYVTNFRRRLMPIVRYPVGDRGVWVDPLGTPSRRFKLLGRSEKGARVGPMTLYLEDLQLVLSREAADTSVYGFQLVIDHLDRLDRCTLRVAVADPTDVPAELTERVAAALYAERKMFQDLIREGLVHPLSVEWIKADDLITNPRTGKMMRILDRRHGS